MITERTQVSSVVSSTEQQASRGRSLNRRAPIVWDTGAGGVGNCVGPLKELMALFKGTTSTSPQRTPANVAAAAVNFQPPLKSFSYECKFSMLNSLIYQMKLI